MKKILIALMLLASPAFADTCATGLMPLFTGPQAAEICATFSAGTIGTLANNTYAVARNAANNANINVWKVDATDDTVLNADTGDVIKLSVAGTSEVQIDNDSLTFTGAAASIIGGATSLTIGSAGTTVIDPQNDANRVFTFTATSDTALNLKIGDTTASQVINIGAGTSDASDTSILELSGGGGTAVDGTRGAALNLYGNESSGSGKADIVMGGTANLRVIGNTGAQAVLTVEGDADGGVVINTGRLDFSNAASTLKPGATSFQINNNANSVANLKINDAGDIHVGAAKDLTFDVGLATVSLQEAVAGTACMGTLTANGATPVVTSTTCATTGSRIFTSRTSAETGTVNAWVSAISNGVSFSITSEAADTGTYNWIIFHEAP